MKYSKESVEIEAIKSIEQGRITDALGVFILERSREIALSTFRGSSKELTQALVDDAVMRCCEKFVFYYKEGGSAANLIISMIFSSMYNKMTSLNWSDVYGHNMSGRVIFVEDGTRTSRYVKYIKDDNLSKDL